MNDPLETPLQHVTSVELGAHDDALYKTLERMMQTTPDMNLLLSRLNRGEAEDIAAGKAFAHGTFSPVLVQYYNDVLMARRAEGGHFFEKLLGAVRHIGRAESSPRQGLFGLRQR